MDVAELPPMTDEESAEYDREWTASAWKGRAKYDAEWRGQGKAVAWIEPVPTYLGACDWDWYALNGKPDHACIRTIRFVQLGGGQIRYQEKFCDLEHRYLSPEGRFHPEYDGCFRYGRRLQVKAVTPDGIRIAHGRLDGFHYELNMDAVVFPGQFQDIADGTAATLRLLVGDDGMPLDKETFMALLDGAEGCAFCKRALADPVSKLIGYGPDCAKKHGLAHTTEAANAVLAKRQTLGL